MNKEGMNGVVAVALLFVISVVSVVGFQSWFNTFSTQTLSGIESQSSSNIISTGPRTILASELYFNNGYTGNLTISKVIVGGNDCNFSGIISGGLQAISLSNNCTQNLASSVSEIVVYTDKGIFSSKIKVGTLASGVSYSSCTLDSITINHNQNYTFYNSSTVPFGSSCSSIQRVCTDGTYSGDDTYNHSSCSVEGQDITPDAFAFTNQTNIELSTLTTSDIVTPTGYEGPLSVGVTGDGSPQLSVDGGGWTTSTTMNPGETLQLRLNSSTEYENSSYAIVTLGDFSYVWSVKTIVQDIDPSPFTFTNLSNVASSTLTTSDIVTPTSYDGPLVISISGEGNPQLSVDGGGWTTSTSINPEESLQIRLTSSSQSLNSSIATLIFGNYIVSWNVTTSPPCSSGSQTYSSAGNVSLEIPVGCFSLLVKSWGGGGGATGQYCGSCCGTSGAGGGGGYSTATISVTPEESVIIVVGAGGAGGTYSIGGGGGGYSGVFRDVTPLIIAGGGGGGAGSYHTYNSGNGGAGGGTTGESGQDANGRTGGTGGTQIAGGILGILQGGGTNGSYLIGGIPDITVSHYTAGWGGAGYYGGGGGGHGDTSVPGAGGGGGSGYIPAGGTTTQGSGKIPGNIIDGDYSYPAGYGANNGASCSNSGSYPGNPGRVVVYWS